MTRTLPWLDRASNSAIVRSKRRLENSTPRLKRPRHLEDSSDIEPNLPRAMDHTGLQSEANEPLTSPPRAPEESFMEKGIDHDDRYRMVEDEFLETAKLFTQNLHAAEYKRMKEAARRQHAEAVTTISRPVTQRMSNFTKRKVDGVAKAEKQSQLVRSLVGKNNKAEEDLSDDDGSAWIGTALHDLMDSPRKSAASLLAVGSINVSTRAAAGFRKSMGCRNAKHEPVSPTIISTKHVPTKSSIAIPPEERQESSDDEDDLDGPATSKSFARSPSRRIREWSMHPEQKHAAHSFDQSLAASFDKPISAYQDGRYASVAFIKKESRPEASSSDASADSAARIARRLEHTRSQKIKKEKEVRLKLDDIPTFL